MKGGTKLIHITGHIYYDPQRTMGTKGSEHGIANVTVVLQDVNSLRKLGVYTNNVGQYAFHDVPPGDYRIVEAYGEPAVSSPGKFDENALVGPIPTATVPPIGYAPNPPLGATHLDCVTPNTIYITAGSDNINVEDILNGPVAYHPIETIMDSCATVSEDNLLDDADYGSIGSFAAGHQANFGPAIEPYPGIAPDFEYVVPDPNEFVPDDGQYTIQNIMNNSSANELGSWWRIADRTTGNEQGRMMVINGYEPGSIFFMDPVDVTPHTNYLFSAWILNLFKVTGYPDPALGVRILDENDDVLYSQTLGQLIPVNQQHPEWHQIGTVINSRDNTRLTVKFLSEGPAAWGNDYAIDDISLNEILLPVFVPVKSVDKSVAAIGETVVFTVTIENTCSRPLTDVTFTDMLPEGLTFVPDSVTINGMAAPGTNPEQGFALPNIAGRETIEVCFSAEATSVPARNPAINKAEASYNYTPIEQGIPDLFTMESNEVAVRIRHSEPCIDVPACDKTVCRAFDVSVPATISPYARLKEPDTECVGPAHIRPGHRPCPDGRRYFEFTLNQKINVDIPIKFGAEVCFDEVCVEDEGECSDQN